MYPTALLRSEGVSGPLRRLLAAVGVWAALVLGSVAPGSALEDDPPPTPAGTRILNSASVEFSTPTGTQRIL